MGSREMQYASLCIPTQAGFVRRSIRRALAELIVSARVLGATRTVMKSILVVIPRAAIRCDHEWSHPIVTRH
eukprot:6195415-Pleurochrysis_carterae.AAC.1